VKLGTYETLELERTAPGVLTIFLNRPEVLNALDRRMRLDLINACEEASMDQESLVVILTGRGRGFCSGADMNRLVHGKGDQSGNLRGPSDVPDEGRRIIDAVMWIQKPLIAMVNGPAVGFGATLALLCDIVLVDEEAVIGDRHVDVGLVAGDGGAAIWPLLVGVARSKEMLMTGRLITGREAAAMGLVSRALPGGELLAATLDMAATLAEKPPFALKATKAAINLHLRRALDLTLDLGLAWEHICMERPDHIEASRRFLDRPRES